MRFVTTTVFTVISATANVLNTTPPTQPHTRPNTRRKPLFDVCVWDTCKIFRLLCCNVWQWQSVVTETKQTIFVLRKTKQECNTLLHSVWRQSINKQYNYGLIWDKQPMCLCVCVCDCVQTRLVSLSGMRWEVKDERCSVLQMTNKWQHTHTHTHTDTLMDPHIHSRKRHTHTSK